MYWDTSSVVTMDPASLELIGLQGIFQRVRRSLLLFTEERAKAQGKAHSLGCEWNKLAILTKNQLCPQCFSVLLYV